MRLPDGTIALPRTRSSRRGRRRDRLRRLARVGTTTWGAPCSEGTDHEQSVGSSAFVGIVLACGPLGGDQSRQLG